MMSRVDILRIQHFTVDKDNWPPVEGGYLNLTVPTRRLICPPHCLQHHTPSRFCTKASPWGDVSWQVSVGYHIWDSNWEFRKDNSVVVLWCRARRITLWHFGSTSSTFRRVCCYYVWYGSDIVSGKVRWSFKTRTAGKVLIPSCHTSRHTCSGISTCSVWKGQTCSRAS